MTSHRKLGVDAYRHNAPRIGSINFFAARRRRSDFYDRSPQKAIKKKKNDNHTHFTTLEYQLPVHDYYRPARAFLIRLSGYRKIATKLEYAKGNRENLHTAPA